MRRPPPVATWVPLSALLLLAGLSAYVTHEVPQSASARLLRSANAFCRALSTGDLDEAARWVAPRARTRANYNRLAYVLEARRGSPWNVVRVRASDGTTLIVWGDALVEAQAGGDVVRKEVLHWALQPDGAWKLVL